MERLSAADSWYLYLETPAAHMQVSGVAVIGTDEAASPPTFDQLREHVAGRLDLDPQFRQRPMAVPLGLDHPVWVEDEHFRLDDHLHHHVLRRGSTRSLEELVGAWCSEPLPRDRPLWDMVWVEGLGGGRAALLTKLHHAVVDGSTGVGLVAHVLDTSRHPVESEGRPVAAGATGPSGVALAVDAALSRLADPLRPVRAAGRLGRSAAALARASVGELRRDPWERAATPLAAPRTPFNGRLTARRSVAMGRAPLGQVRAVATACGTTVTEVVLAACTTGLRRQLRAAGVPARGPLVCSVPATMRRRRHDAGPGGRRDGPGPPNLLVHLPVFLEDPLAQLRQVHRSVEQASRVQSALAPATVGDVADLVPSALLRSGAGWWSRLGLADRVPPAHNLVVSSVPGSPVPLYLAGAPVVGMYPFGPLTEGVGLNVTVVADQEDLDIGLVACPDLVPDVHLVLDGVLEGLGLLEELATSGEQLDLTGPVPQRRRFPRRPPATRTRW